MPSIASYLDLRRTPLLQSSPTRSPPILTGRVDSNGEATGRASDYSVLHVVEALRGGPATYMREILPAQCQALGANNIGLIIPRSQAKELPDAAAIPTRYFTEQRFRALHIPVLAWRTRQWVKQYRPSVVHAQGTLAGLAVRVALGGIVHAPKIVYCSHGWAFDRSTAAWKNAVVAWLERSLARRCDSIVCISQHDYRSALKTGIERSRLVEIRNAVSEVETVPADVVWPDKRRRFLFVGRFDHQKGIDLFLQAMAQLGDEAFAYAIGSPAVGRPQRLRAPDNVRFTGWLPRDKVLSYVASADVVVVPSRWEGFGLAALEAMRAGRPIIASKIGGLPELVRHGNTGLLVQPDDVDSLVTAMRTLTRWNLKAMGARARLRYERSYQAQRLNAELLALYQKLLDAQPSAEKTSSMPARSPIKRHGVTVPGTRPMQSTRPSEPRSPGSR